MTSIIELIDLIRAGAPLHRTELAVADSSACAAPPHLCSVCWTHIRASLATHVTDDAHRAALLAAGDRFVALLDSPLCSVRGAPTLCCRITTSTPTNVPPKVLLDNSADASTPFYAHCAACARPLDGGVAINALDLSFHEACFQCSEKTCQRSLADPSTPFFAGPDGLPKCEKCFLATQY